MQGLSFFQMIKVFKKRGQAIRQAWSHIAKNEELLCSMGQRILVVPHGFGFAIVRTMPGQRPVFLNHLGAVGPARHAGRPRRSGWARRHNLVYIEQSSKEN